MVNLLSERLIIRDPVMDDLEEMHELMSNSKAMKYWECHKTNTIEETKEQLVKSIEESKSVDRSLYFFKILKKDEMEYIGEIGYTVILKTPFGKIASLGYAIKEKFRNKGYTTEAVKRLMEFAFEENNVYRFMIGCLKENIGSEKVIQKCGFIKEADFKEFVYHEGKLKDRVDYRLLKSEWKKY